MSGERAGRGAGSPGLSSGGALSGPQFPPCVEALGENGKAALSGLGIPTFPFPTFPRGQACVSAALADGDPAGISSP